MKKILFVDDDENILKGYRRTLHGKYMVAAAVGPKQGLEMLKIHPDFAVIISDFTMPEMNGMEFFNKVKTILPDASRILITGNAKLDMVIEAVNSGNIFRFLTKPCTTEKMISTIEQAIEQHNLLTLEKRVVQETLKGSIKMLVEILASVNSAAFSKSNMYRDLGKKIARKLSLENMWEIEIGCLLSQLGCVALPNDVIKRKIQGQSLTPEEIDLFLSHPKIGKKLLSNIPRLESIADAISYQFNNYSSSVKGAVTGEDIPLVGRLLKLLNDYFDYLLTNDNDVEALNCLLEDDSRYDPLLLSALESEIKGISTGYVEKKVSFDKLKPGMILEQDLLDSSKVLLIPKGVMLTSESLKKMSNYARMKGIIEPIHVTEKIPDIIA